MNFSFDWKTNAIAIIRLILNLGFVAGRLLIYASVFRTSSKSRFKNLKQRQEEKWRICQLRLRHSIIPFHPWLSTKCFLRHKSSLGVVPLRRRLSLLSWGTCSQLSSSHLAKKSLYLVINMAFADLVLGGASLPLFVYLVTATRSRLYFTEFPTFLQIIFTVSSMASFTTAALISAERFYAVFWPLKHRTLSTRAYKLVILMAWTLPILFSTA